MKISFKPHKPKIIPRPGRRGAEQPAVSGASGQVAQVFGTHSAFLTCWQRLCALPAPA